jgi:membrane associated rhomboid family serine protease
MMLWAETGLLGLAAFVWLLYSAIRQPVRGPFRVAGLALLLAWCITSLFSSHFQSFNEGHLIAILLGVCLAREKDQPASIASTAARTSS